MKLALKLLTFHIFIFTSLSTLLMLHIFRNISFNSNQVVLQNIICNSPGDGESGADETIAIEVENLRRKRPDEIGVHSLREVIKSLKHDIYAHRYKDAVWYATSRRSQASKFDHRLSVYSGRDFNLMHSLFPPLVPNSLHPSSYEDRIQKQIDLKVKSTTPKLILVVSPNTGLTQDNFLNSNCNVKDCIFTENITLADSADAIIFSGTNKIFKTPSNRVNQIWVYYNIESPVHNLDFGTSISINWTATYRSTSVLPTPYGKFVPYPDVYRLPLKTTKNFSADKKKLAAIFVSNCESKNGRLQYVNELKKYASIDVYGRCGDMKCNKTNNNCFDMLKKDYKFYLAFENSNCRDYITEKFFYNALQHDVVPIVMGAHPDDYKKVAPPNSFIHVDEFNSPRQLAEYIHILDNNDDLYNQYFRWKQTGTFINTKFSCRLCSMLQIAPNFPRQPNDISDILREEKKDCILSSKTEERWKKWK